jgi:ABC-2 type transport system ATP-binding protein/sodium transport system ATP-binding protein
MRRGCLSLQRVAREWRGHVSIPAAFMIDVHHLTKQFPLPGGATLVAVNDLSFHVGAGEVYGLLGPNGAGKTTTIRMLLGLLRPTSGQATIAGYTSSEAPDEVKRRVGLVSASAGLYSGLTVREMLLFFADLYAVPRGEAQAELERLTTLLGITEFLRQRCATLSTGQRQRVNLARALIHRPPVMLLDEPTLGLDVLGSQVVVEYIEHLRSEGKAVILTTHRLDEAERLCTRFGLLHKGRLVSEGTLEELQARSGCATLTQMFLKLSQVGPQLSGQWRLPRDGPPSPSTAREPDSP